MTDSDGLCLGDETSIASHRAFGEDVIEQHSIDSADHQVLVRMHVVVVGDGLNAAAPFGLEENVVGHRAAESGHLAAAQIRHCAEATGIGATNGEDFAELVVRNADAERGTTARAVFNAAQADLEVTASRRLIE